MSKLQSLLEAVADKKPHDFKEVFDDVMVEKMRAVVDEYRDVVAESMFVEAEEAAEEEEEISEDDEEDESVEEEQHLDEISAAKALRISDDAWSKARSHPEKEKKYDRQSKKFRDYANKKIKAIDKAAAEKRMNKEEEQHLDEISKKKLGQYINKAKGSHKRHYDKADPDWDDSQTPSYGTKDDQKYHWRKMTNRETGISQAKRRLSKD